MTLRFKYIVGLAAVAAGLVSCVKEDFENAANGSYDGIQFNISTVDTKTVYGAQASDNSWPLYWVAGDPIRIYCAEAEDAKQADYTVTPSSANSNTGSMALASGSTALQWGGDSNDHNFYAVYPNTATIENGIATFQINRNQKATVTTTNGYDNDVVAAPDMRNAYMVAKTTTQPTDEAVGLTFKPIMTTLDVVIKAANVNMNETGSARITGISLASTMTSNSTASKDQFYYDITKGAITANGASTSGTSTTMTEQTFVNLVDQSGNASYVDLASGHTLTITVFLPPMSEAAAANMKRQVKVRVHATGNTELVASLKTNETSSDWTTQLTPGTKRRVVLPALPTNSQYSGNNWITPLDGHIYITNMSIPGTHDAGTGGSSDGIVSGLAGMVAADTQETTISEQLNMGIRCFDLRPGQYNNELRIYHGVVRYASSFHDALGTITDYLISNPGEFAIVIMRHESEIGNLSGLLELFKEDQSEWSTLMRASLDKERTYSYNNSEVKYTIQSKIVKYHPDLTISDMRGKILLITRDDYTYGETGADGKSGGFTNSAVIQANNITSSAYSKAPYKVQDYYDYGSDQEGKINIIKAMLDQSSSSVTNTLYLNHCSGYQDGDVTLTGYRGNSSVINPEIYKYITSTDFKGSTGIIMLDYVGSHKSGGVTVYGDLLPQAIIDNNYKYRMKRKGE